MEAIMAIYMSVIIPAYNESERLPAYLEEVFMYFYNSVPRDYEVLIVDDGSTDGSREACAVWKRRWPRLSVIHFPRNCGKGTAVRAGMLEARGEFLLFADADGATPISEERALRRKLQEGADLAVGSRPVGGTSTSNSCFVRAIARRGLSILARRLLGLPVCDTQCGFKMFRRAAARELFPNCREAGFAFDIELLCLAHEHGYEIAEVPVSWRDVAGSKVRLISDGARVLFCILRMWYSYARHRGIA
jgi:dolichyl-phosphate beta-glucosyltransferase